MTSAPGIGGVVVVERGGRIRLVQGRKRRTFTNISGSVSTGGERGLLSVAFAPDYATSRLLYVYFTNGAGDLVIAELRADRERTARRPGAPCARSLIVPHPNQSNHNGGQLQFGPDGLLYAGTGRRGRSGRPTDNAQNPNSRLGKLLRIDPVLRRGRRSIRSACATRTASPSTWSPIPGSRGSRSATSARTASRRSTTCRWRRRTAPTSAGTTSRASPRSPARIPPPRARR